jgi:hypothetical protein
VNFYLSALHGRREFTTEERSKARAALLREMVANVTNDKRGGIVGPEPILDPSPIERFYAAMPGAPLNKPSLQFEVRLARASVAGGLADARYDEYEDLEAARFSAPTADIRHAETRHRPRNRRVFAFVATTAVLALAVFAIAPRTWFGPFLSDSTPSVVAQLPPLERSTPVQTVQSPIDPSLAFGRRAPVQTVQSPLPFGASNSFILPREQSLSQTNKAQWISELLKRGNDLIAAGDINAARIVLQDAADAGNATAALMLGATFDPNEFAGLKKPDAVRLTSPVEMGGVPSHPDVEIARSWYEKARDLGSTEAAERLKKLPD